MAASRRILKEIEDISKDPPANCTAGPIDGNIYVWEGMIFGPDDSPFVGGVFKLRIQFPADYPQATFCKFHNEDLSSKY